MPGLPAQSQEGTPHFSLLGLAHALVLHMHYLQDLSPQVFRGEVTIIPVLHVNKWRLREAKARGHIARKQWGLVLIPGVQTPNITLPPPAGWPLDLSA